MAKPLTNYIAYELKDGTNRPRVGHFDVKNKVITPLAYASGTPLSNLYEVLEIGSSAIIPYGKPILSDSVKIQPPFTDRDVLAIGKNYAEHAKEFNASGYDASDKVDMPSHPVVFTKRATSIIADGEDILPLPEFTSTLDYEGEIGVIIGKTGHRISEQDAGEYVWGYTIINDVTAREKQRDHKQFYIGKSGDTFCPMGPIAVPKEDLPKVLKVQTKVNGQLRQEATTDDLIFSVNTLIKTLSESQTLQPGDVIATGTPAGVGFGLKPPTFLKPGDVVEISVTGLGTLQNRIAQVDDGNHVQNRISNRSIIPTQNLKVGGAGLKSLNGKLLYTEVLGNSNGEPIVFIHGLGGSSTFFKPLIASLDLPSTNHLILYDLEGHGQSPTIASSVVSIKSFTKDLEAIFQSPDFKLSTGAIIIAHSMGCFVATLFAAKYPELVKKLILVGPPPNPLSRDMVNGMHDRAAKVREVGMRAIADTVAINGISKHSKTSNPLAYATVLQSLLGTDEEGYAKGCTALAGSADVKIEFAGIRCETLVVTGDEDKVSDVARCEGLVKGIQKARLEVLEGVGHWIGFEDSIGLGRTVKAFL
jgi:2-keto-4-pentenoate hydratase/2-oxohepta-3-ene-1,7-dioic acid hydratase in catechol pathway/pimeloyl-ACP methyl ester carboxylesterase